MTENTKTTEETQETVLRKPLESPDLSDIPAFSGLSSESLEKLGLAIIEKVERDFENMDEDEKEAFCNIKSISQTMQEEALELITHKAINMINSLPFDKPTTTALAFSVAGSIIHSVITTEEDGEYKEHLKQQAKELFHHVISECQPDNNPQPAQH